MSTFVTANINVFSNIKQVLKRIIFKKIRNVVGMSA